MGIYGFTRQAEAAILIAVASVGENIRSLREKAGYKTQGAFAKALNVSQPRLSDWENDRHGVPEVPNLLKIAKTLGVSLDQIITGLDPAYDVLRKRPPSDAPPVTNPVTEHGVQMRHTPAAPSQGESRAESAAVHPPIEDADKVRAARELFKHAAALSALANSLMHGFVAARHPPTAERSRVSSGVSGRAGRPAGQGRKR